MPTYAAPIDNFRFVLNDVLAAGETMAKFGLTEATPDVLEAVIEEAGKLCTNVLQPLNLPGDTEGCTFENGVVRTPKGFKEAYDQFREGCWVGLTADPAYGGQGLPHFINQRVGGLPAWCRVAGQAPAGLAGPRCCIA
jgi:alkylation response protein AidB-like acyl-CoA dehydrogenase